LYHRAGVGALLLLPLPPQATSSNRARKMVEMHTIFIVRVLTDGEGENLDKDSRLKVLDRPFPTSPAWPVNERFIPHNRHSKPINM